ncbi:MAG: hypothetical protein IPK13_01435 [Deltaproteobacteria bacterium]|nr:hypothetical protein [Deltaproteobacteria bacterium]
MNGSRRLTSRTRGVLWGGLIGGVLGLVALVGLTVGCILAFPEFLDDLRTWNGGVHARAVVLGKAFNESALSDKWLIRYRFRVGDRIREAEIPVRRADYDALTAGDKFEVRFLPGLSERHVTEFQEFRTAAAAHGLPVFILLLVAFTIAFAGRFGRWLSHRNLLLHGVEVPFVLTSRMRVFWPRPLIMRQDWYVDYIFAGRTYSRRVVLPKCNFPYPNEPARDAVVLVDPARPRRCHVARRSAFLASVVPADFRETLASVLRGLAEFIAGFESIDRQNEQLRRKLRALERDVRHGAVPSFDLVVASINRELSQHPPARRVLFCWLLAKGPEMISGDELNVLERLGTFRELCADVSYRLSLIGAAIIVAVPSVGLLASNGSAAAFVDGVFLAALFFGSFAVLRFCFWLDRG